MKNNILLFKKIDPNKHARLLYEMDIKAFTRDFDYPSPSVELTLDYFKNCQTYLAYNQKTLIGVFAFTELDDVIEVKQVIVLPAFQHQGFGSQIIKKIIKLNRVKNIWLVTHPRNSTAIMLYLKNQFEITMWINNYYGDDQPRLKLEYKLR